MIKEVGLYFNNISPNNGPGKVCQNLLMGLERLGVKCQQNTTMKYTGCLHTVPQNITPEMLLGPNLFVLPNDVSPEFWKTKRNLVTPSEWVKNKYEAQLGVGHNISVWPSGVDTDKFKPGVDWSLSKTNDCMIYFKNGSKEQKQELINILKKKNLSYQEITYGSYDEEHFIELTQSSKFCVTLTSTESQGMAYLEILSMNVPVYTLDKTVWDDRSGVSFPATSAPYFDARCGIKCLDLSFFDTFLSELPRYEPRDYILENLTLEKCASEYLSLLENCYESKE